MLEPQVLVALITTLGSVAAAGLGAWVALRNRGGTKALDDIAAALERAELAEAREERWKLKAEAASDRAVEEAKARAAAEARADFAERDSDACERRLSAVYAEMRASGQLVDRRARPRTEEGGTEASA
jgi:hypothetical protein